MRLIDLLTNLDDDTLERLAHPRLAVGETGSRAVTCINLESAIRSPKHVRETVLNLQPPAFELLQRLLDADDHQVPHAGLREVVQADTMRLAEMVTTQQILGGERESAVRLYRKMLTEARRSDLELDPSEAALLGVLRHELALRQVEHFLIEHHADLQAFWNTDHAFLDVTTGLRTSGLVFVLEGSFVLPDDIVPLLRQILGLEMSTGARRRLFERFSGQDLAAALGASRLRTSGTREEKCLRLLENYVQPSEVLSVLSLATLRDLCRDLSLPVGGAKDDLADRVLLHFAQNHDIRPEAPPPPPPPPEPRVLDPAQFDALFSSLRLQDLSDILAGIGSRRITGAKDHLVGLLRDSRFAEISLLMELDSRQLEAALDRNRLRTTGAKRDRAQRLVDDFATKSASPPLAPGLE